MKILISFSIAFLICASVAIAQKEGNIWHFGQGAALDFNTGTPQVTSPSSIWTSEGSASIADANGNLLFYTNGGGRDPVTSGQSTGKIWNKQHGVMYDMGYTEGGGFSAAQSAVIIPRPGVAGNYYLFTMEEIEFSVGGDVPGQPLGRGLSWFEIDMALNGGLGGVVDYKGLQYIPTYEGLCAIKQANGTDYWIVVHRSDNQGLAIFPVNGLGVGSPQLFTTSFLTGGIIKASPDGKWLTCLSDGGEQVLFQFDPASGTASNIQILDAYPNFTEFSPNSKRLFMTTDNEVQYFDLTNPNINSSKTVVDDFPGFDFNNGFNYIIGQMQLAPDGKIYMLRSDFETDSVWLSAIVCPNSNPFLEINTIGYTTNPGSTFLGLPNFDNSIFKRESDIFTVNLGPDQALCGGTPLTLDAGAGGGIYSWSTGATTQTLEINTPGLYFVKVATGCGTGIDSILIENTQALANAGKDTTICKGVPLQLTGSSNGTISWSPANAVDNPNIAAPFFTSQSTTDLTITTTVGGCSQKDTVTVVVVLAPVATAVPTDTTVVQGIAVTLSGGGSNALQWSPTPGLSCTNCPNPVATPEVTTTYILTATSPEGCTDTTQVTIRVTPPECKATIPNAFSPNGDQTNDDFKPFGNVDNYQLTIYNRWGQRIYEGTSPWNGSIEGKDAPVDLYLYRITVTVCGEMQVFSGEVTLLR